MGILKWVIIGIVGLNAVFLAYWRWCGRSRNGGKTIVKMIEMKAGAVNSLGRIGENEYRTARFDVGGILREFPEAEFQVVNQRPGDPAAYPVNAANVTRDGESLLWTLTSADLASEGIGSCEVIAYDGEKVAKTAIYTTRTGPALDGSGTPPEPWESWVEDVKDDADRAEAAAALLEHPGAEAETLSPGESATAAYADGVFSFGIPQGEKGDPGDPGADGFSPVASVTKSGDTATISITDKTGTTTATVKDGTDGQDGQPGADGYSPSASVSKSGATATITITDKSGTTTATVSDGTPVIDDTAGSGDTDKVWSADKAAGEVSNLNGAINAKQDILRVTSLTQIPVASGQVVESVGIPVYVDDVTDYSAYGITETGWYEFVRITAKEGVTVSAQTTVTGADGYIATIGADHVDIAVRFGVAAQSKTVTIAWKNNNTESFVFRATDLAVRNLDYRSTFYIYDIADFAEWTWALTADETFQDGVNYYTESGGEYTLATVTVGDTIPANTYYVHSKLTFSGMIRNVTYRFNEMVDCPIEIVLPEVPDDGYGAWFEIQMQYSKAVSTTLLPTDPTVVIGTASTQSQTAGINVIDLQYSGINEVKMWTLLNTHSNLPTSGGA